MKRIVTLGDLGELRELAAPPGAYELGNVDANYENFAASQPCASAACARVHANAAYMMGALGLGAGAFITWLSMRKKDGR